MARFAEVYGDRSHRIEAINHLDRKLRVLDVKLADAHAKVLDESDARFAYDRAAVAHQLSTFIRPARSGLPLCPGPKNKHLAGKVALGATPLGIRGVVE